MVTKMKKITNHIPAVRAVSFILALAAALILSMSVLAAQPVHAASNFLIRDIIVFVHREIGRAHV